MIYVTYGIRQYSKGSRRIEIHSDMEAEPNLILKSFGLRLHSRDRSPRLMYPFASLELPLSGVPGTLMPCATFS